MDVYFTELDVNMQYVDGSKEQRNNLQARIYKQIISAGIETGVKDITVFGVRDNESWLIDWYGFTKSNALLIDDDGNYKPAYYAVVQALSQFAEQTEKKVWEWKDVTVGKEPKPQVGKGSYIYVEGEWIQYPENVSLIYLEDGENDEWIISPESSLINTAVKEYSQAMELKEEDVKIQYKVVKDVQGNKTVVGYTNYDPDLSRKGEELEGKVPLLVGSLNERGETIWSEATPGKLGKLLGIPFGGMIEKYPETQEVFKSFNAGIISSIWGVTGAADGVNNSIDFSQYEDFQLSYAHDELNIPYERTMIDAAIWGAHYPKGFENLTRDQARSWLINYVTQFMEHFKGKAKYIIVVNEPGNDDTVMKSKIPDYIELVFNTARSVDPNASLVLNQTDNHGPQSQYRGTYVSATKALVPPLYEKGIVDLLGVQGHLSYYKNEAPTEDQMYEVMNSYGIPFLLTEADANIQEVEGKDRYFEQAKWYKRLIKAALRTGKCKGIFLWGAFPDNKSWYELSLHEPNADPTPWYDDLSRKPAYYSIIQAMYEILAKSS